MSVGVAQRDQRCVRSYAGVVILNQVWTKTPSLFLFP